MFAHTSDVLKVALVSLVRQLQVWEFRIIDCQQASPHVMRFGAEEIPRWKFLDHLNAALTLPERRGHWESEIP